MTLEKKKKRKKKKKKSKLPRPCMHASVGNNKSGENEKKQRKQKKRKEGRKANKQAERTSQSFQRKKLLDIFQEEWNKEIVNPSLPLKSEVKLERRLWEKESKLAKLRENENVINKLKFLLSIGENEESSFD